VRPERPSAGNACSIASASDITAAALVRLISTTPSRSTSCLYARGMHSDPHVALGKSRCGGHRHGLLVKIWSRSPRSRTFEVTAARLACDAHPIRCTVGRGVAADA
jgi:hypothetical protein